MAATIPSFVSLFLSSSAIAQQKNNPTTNPVAPEIDFQGSDVTGTRLKIAIGQQVTFSSPQSGETQEWRIPNAILFAYFNQNESSCPKYPNAPNPIGCVVYGDDTHPYFHSTTTTFYFAAPGVYHLDYNYTIGSQSFSSSVILDVVGPSLAPPAIHIGDINLWPTGCTDRCTIALGNPTQRPVPPQNYGVTIDFNATQPKMFPGKFTWAQVINAQDSFTSNTGINYTCDIETGLDVDYPWRTDLGKAPGSKIPDSEFWDVPSRFFVYPNEKSHTINFTANTYLLWQPNTAAAPYTISSVEESFPVLLSYGGWGWYGTANYSETDGMWDIIQSSTYTTPFTNETPGSYNVLDWGSIVPYRVAEICHRSQ